MTVRERSDPVRTIIGQDELEQVVAAAGRAPSIHNTQPWSWHLVGNEVQLRADRRRQLHVADRDGHSLLISCGAAAELTDLALRALGWSVVTTLVPDRADLDLLARFRLGRRGEPDGRASQRLAVAQLRRSERRVFGPDLPSAATIGRLETASEEAGVHVHFTSTPEEAVELAVLISRADRWQREDPAYAAEMASWVRAGGASDGVPAASIPVLSGDEPRHTDVPLRDFDAGTPGTQLVTGGVDERPLLAVVLTDGDGPSARLRAGRAMMRLMIEAERSGLSSCPLSQSVDLLAFRTRLRTLMSWTGYPQMMLRIGQTPAGAGPPLTPRRPVAEVLR